ncbi:Hsp20/alpha crystallin family protein [Cochleicola gelatinilyticus]|uniref:SHSP domain-containing protein n=1 Tax=Cochleicola gelatinilyticus TaxID=1763537 RepID=A0A167HJF0_9FLAO|nr:Hsp20/alpha crystallin family protein [Cochleicola gelatinilyticus]OAB78674.1 hypothetical protein ULVI_08820 [Cochleicola gelatinilyticus]
MKLTKRNSSLMPNVWNQLHDDDWFRLPDTFKQGASMPAINIKDNENEFIVELAVPGMKRDDFKVDVDNDLLTISAEEKNERIEEDATYTRREFSYSSFKRSFNLPELVDEDNITANYKDGVLGVVIPKKEEAKPKPPKSIEIA